MREALPRGGHASDRAIDRPIMLLGTGRSGTTLAMRLTAAHPDLAWISQYTNRFPGLPELASVSRLIDLEPARRVLPPRWRLTPQPRETIGFTRYVTDGVFNEPRELAESDATTMIRMAYRRAVLKHMHWQGKPRFTQKHTGFPRTRFLRAIFPDARFVHVLRDGRAVANSMLHVAWWDGTMDSWWWGAMPAEYEEEYRASGKEPIVLAAIVWKRLIDLIGPAMAELPMEQSLTVRYDDLVGDTEAAMTRLAEFCDLERSERFLSRVREFSVSDADDKWKGLPRQQVRLLETSLADHLDRLGFN